MACGSQGEPWHEASVSLIVAVLVIAARGGVVLWIARCMLPGDRDAPARNATTQIINAGEYLARAGDCIACHTAAGGKEFAGGRAMPTPFGNLYVPNITPDDETGIGQWTADEFYRMMHTGISRDGTLMYPAMPFASYTKVTREDSDAIYAYIMSVPPVRQQNRPHELRFRSTTASSWSDGAPCISSRANTCPIRSNRRSGTAARTSSKGWAIVRCATRPSTCWAERAKRKRSKAA